MELYNFYREFCNIYDDNRAMSKDLQNPEDRAILIRWTAEAMGIEESKARSMAYKLMKDGRFTYMDGKFKEHTIKW